MQRLEVNPYEFDNRMIEWNLKVGKITTEQLKAHLKNLPDEESNSQNIKLDDDPVSEN
jgi:hypothetical protein